MSSDTVRSRIRKLMALAGNNPNENERDLALKKAHDLMLEHGITEVGEESDEIDVIMGDWMEGVVLKANWHRIVGSAVARLYGARHVFMSKLGRHRFAGMAHQIEAAEETFLIVVDQIEALYKSALRAYSGGLSKYQRAELRTSFKDAAAVRVSSRIHAILEERRTKHDRALVIVDTVNEKVEGLFAAQGVKSKALTARVGFGTGAGSEAGAQVRIQRNLK